MADGNTKRIVVIKDIPSNLIEEAILILKCEPGTGGNKNIKDVSQKSIKRDNEYLMKEAEMVIDNYMREIRNQGLNNPALKAKPDAPKKKFITNTFINAALIGSIALLVLILSKVI